MNLIEFLREKNLKQVDIAVAMGMDPALISCWLRGVKKVPERHKENLAKILGINSVKLSGLLKTKPTV